MHARVLVLLAMRNLRRHVRRTVLTASAMIVGGALMVFTFSLGDGSHEQWIDSGVRLAEGHVTIERPEFRVSRRIEDRLPAEVRRAAEEAFRSPDVAPRIVATTAKLAVTGLASSAAGSRPAQIVAVDPAAEAEFSPIDDRLIEGRYLEPDDRLAAYVGVELVDRLELRLGSRFVVQAQDAEREIAGQLLAGGRHLPDRRAGGGSAADAHSAWPPPTSGWGRRAMSPTWGWCWTTARRRPGWPRASSAPWKGPSVAGTPA